MVFLALFLNKAEAQKTNGGAPTVGYTLIEGDILIRQVIPKAVFTTTALWPAGRVPYEFDGNVNGANRAAMLEAMAAWQAVANVQFVARSGEGDYVHIQNGEGNNSELGRNGGSQLINIFNWDRKFIIAHELGHCLGFWHEQSRSNRDQFISVNYGNIQAGQASQFDTHDEASHYGPYDFDSVMHYDRCAFSIDCPQGTSCLCTHETITVHSPYDVEWQFKIGQRDHLSFGDERVMSFLYPYSDWRFVDGSFAGAPRSGTFLKPFTSFPVGESDVPNGGTVWIQPGTYSAAGVHSKPMTWEAPLGGVTLGN